jgi:hypothetical protein
MKAALTASAKPAHIAIKLDANIEGGVSARLGRKKPKRD